MGKRWKCDDSRNYRGVFDRWFSVGRSVKRELVEGKGGKLKKKVLYGFVDRGGRIVWKKELKFVLKRGSFEKVSDRSLNEGVR